MISRNIPHFCQKLWIAQISFHQCKTLYIAHTKLIQIWNYLLIWGINVWWVCLHASTHCLLTLRIFSRNSGASLAVPTWIKRSRNVAIWTFRSHITWNFQKKKKFSCFCFDNATDAFERIFWYQGFLKRNSPFIFQKRQIYQYNFKVPSNNHYQQCSQLWLFIAKVAIFWTKMAIEILEK